MTSEAAMRIWLCDLTYTQQTISSDVMPAAVGHIATYTAKHLGEGVDIRVFKFPEKLAQALANDPLPQLIGFSNYIWNRDLSSEFARVIKKHHPGIATVMGGPNYPTTEGEQAAFLADHPMIDFYVIKEGELAFAKLAEALRAVNYDVAAVPLDVPSVHRLLPDGTFHQGPAAPRILDLAEIPSPYLNGLMDEYFDGVMLPIVQTNRGCPFRCTFCVEGDSYYSRVAKTRDRKVFQELEFIAGRMAALRSAGRARSDLHIADSNFGMYKEDIDLCRHIGELQKRYNYPQYINVATGKNHKERVLDAARLINGALRLSGSVQSLDKDVLKNIDRSNIDEKAIMELALSASEIGANSYSEIILGLPGDTLEAHMRTIRAVVEADFNTVTLYQLMLLPGTDLASRDSVAKWGMRTQYRVLPRCFGYFDVLGEQINAAEIEEICVSNNSLTFEDYLNCRHMHLIVNVFYNDSVFKEVLRLLKLLGLSKFGWIRRLWEHRGGPAFSGFVRDFIEETRKELWESRDDLRTFTRERGNIVRYINGDLGANLIFKYKSLALIRQSAELAEVASATLVDYLESAGASENAIALGRELIEFARLRMTDIFTNREAVHTGIFRFDVARFANDVEPADADSYRLDRPQEYRFVMQPEQIQTVTDFLAIYGDSLMGLTRILSKVYVRRLFRHAQVADVDFAEGGRDVTIGQAALTGLNPFA
jgi:radical SAM superfamily enzyme YgiQ (UPF0313 family)